MKLVIFNHRTVVVLGRYISFVLAAASGLCVAVFASTGARGQSQAARTIGVLSCSSIATSNKSNDFETCNRYLADPGLTARERARVYAGRASAYWSRGHGGLAIRDYTTALSLLAPSNPHDRAVGENLVMRGGVKEDGGDLRGAESDYREALRTSASYLAKTALEMLANRKASKRETYLREDLDRDDLRRLLFKNTLVAGTAREAAPWKAYFAADGPMAIVYGNGSKRVGRWSMDADAAVCVTLEGSASACRRVTKITPIHSIMREPYYLWIDARSGQVDSHIYDSQPGDVTGGGGQRQAADLGGRPLALCRSAGVTAAPHLRTPLRGEKRPRISAVLRHQTGLLVSRLKAVGEHAVVRGGGTRGDLDIGGYWRKVEDWNFEGAMPQLRLYEDVLGPKSAGSYGWLGARGYARDVAVMAELHAFLGYFQEATALYCVALNVYAQHPGYPHQDAAETLRGAALVLLEQGRDGDAEELLQRLKTTVDEMPGTALTDYVARRDAYLNFLAILAKQGRFGEAESAVAAANQAALKTTEPDSAHVAAYEMFYAYGRYSDAERLAKKLVQRGAPATWLAQVYIAQERNEEARAVYKAVWDKLPRRGIERTQDYQRIREVGEALGALYLQNGDPQSAVAISEEAVEAGRRVLAVNPKQTDDLSGPLALLGIIRLETGEAGRAEALLKEALQVAQGGASDSLEMASRMQELGFFYRKTQRYEEARALQEASLKVRLRRLGGGHPHVALNYRALALIAAQQGQWRAAYDNARAGLGIMMSYENAEYRRQAQTWSGERQRPDRQLLSVLIRAGLNLGDGDLQVAEAMFLAAQWLQQTKVGTTVMKMTARTAVAAGEAGDLLREREGLVSRLERAWGRFAGVLAEAGKLDAQTNAETISNYRNLIKELEVQLRDVDARLGQKVGDYATFASIKAVEASEVKAALAPDQALVQLVDLQGEDALGEETVVFVVTRSRLRVYRASLGGQSLAGMVSILRCGLDASEWGRPRPSKTCRDLLGDWKGRKEPLPFSFSTAHDLYEALFGPFRDEIGNKHLLVVSSGALSSLPLHVLVSEAPHVPLGRTWTDYDRVAWLARSNSVTVLPSAASIKALMRRGGTQDGQAIAYMGFGNPLLDGNPDDPHEVAAAKRARGLRTCVDVAALAGVADTGRRALRLLPQDALAPEREVARVEILRVQAPLWETAKEICDVAQAVNARMEHIYLGSRATEQAVRGLSDQGVLRKTRILHFATHGMLATDSEEAKLQVRGEPGLVLTPPRAGAPYEELLKDDGLLTASEIAQLTLDADWVILSACNTAGGERTGGEALSGLARAFFFAGARGLLASHWYVDSDATTDLISGVFAELKKDGRLRRAEGLQRSMRRMFEGASGYRTHPALWAPFVLVGGAGD